MRGFGEIMRKCYARSAESRTEQHDLRGIVDPNQVHHDELRRLKLPADVPGDRELAEIEEDGGGKAAAPGVAPIQWAVREPAEEDGEQYGEHTKGDDEIDRLPESDSGPSPSHYETAL